MPIRMYARRVGRSKSMGQGFVTDPHSNHQPMSDRSNGIVGE